MSFVVTWSMKIIFFIESCHPFLKIYCHIDIMRNIPEEIVQLILLKEVRKLSVNEKNQLQNWLKESSDHELDAEELRLLFKRYTQAKNYEQIDAKVAWQNIQKRIHKSKIMDQQSRKINLWISVAAAIVPLLLIVSLFYYFSGQSSFDDIKAGNARAVLELSNGEKIDLGTAYSGVIKNSNGEEIGANRGNTLVCKSEDFHKNEFNTLTVPIGAEYKVILSDGTKITVNSGSRIRYPYVFGESSRVVELDGEAYFEVAHNKSKPFFVKTSGATVKVTGTKFNVCNYRDDIFEHVTLEEGSVEVNKGDSVYKLIPGMQFYLDKQKLMVKTKTVDSELFTSWKNGMFRFQNMTLSQLTKQMHRWYNVQFVFKTPECKDLRFTGAFERNSNFAEFVKIIESTTQVQFSLRGKTIYISKNN